MRPILPICFLAFLPVTLNAAEPPAISVTTGKEAIVVTAGKIVVARYNHGERVAKPYFWPLLATDGTPVTRAWPMDKGNGTDTTDHVHHKSAWFCHGDVIPEGIELKKRSADKRVVGVDFWSESANHGTIVCTRVDQPKVVSPAHSLVATANEWRTPDGETILMEARTIHFRSLQHGTLIELDIVLTASRCPITFGDTKEGSLGVRVHDSLRTIHKAGGNVTSSDKTSASAPAKDNLPMWGKLADWHDYSGKVDDKLVGVAIFDDTKNAHRAAWHTRAYGLMAANPFGRERSGFPAMKGKNDLVKLNKGDDIHFRYGVYVHKGDAQSADVAAAYQEFVNQK